jgi:hypothetical protein
MQNSNPTTNSNDNSQNQNSTMPANNIDDLLKMGSNVIEPAAQAPIVEQVTVVPTVEQPIQVVETAPVVQPTVSAPIVSEPVVAPVVETPVLNVEVVPDANVTMSQQVEVVDPNQLAQSVQDVKPEVTQAPIEVPQSNVAEMVVKPIESVAAPVIPEASPSVSNPINDSTFTPGPALDAPMPGMQENTVNVQNLNVTDIMETQTKSDAPMFEAKPEVMAQPVEAVRQVPTEVNPQLNGIFDAVPSEINITPSTNESSLNIPVENNITSAMPTLGNSESPVNSANTLPSIETINPIINTVPKAKGGFSIVRFILWTVILLLGILSLVIGFYFAKLVQIPFLDTLFQ